jgi:hypothetical protein
LGMGKSLKGVGQVEYLFPTTCVACRSLAESLVDSVRPLLEETFTPQKMRDAGFSVVVYPEFSSASSSSSSSLNTGPQIQKWCAVSLASYSATEAAKPHADSKFTDDESDLSPYVLAITVEDQSRRGFCIAPKIITPGWYAIYSLCLCIASTLCGFASLFLLG